MLLISATVPSLHAQRQLPRVCGQPAGGRGQVLTRLDFRVAASMAVALDALQFR
ncbi:MAG: hypothetical protein ACRDRG_04990 [Pseudonocardiaceae bacterium]